MRDWKVDPIVLCRKHLLGSHVESHMTLGAIKKGKSLNGYIDKGLIDVTRLSKWHDAVAQEITERGWNHKSPYEHDIARQAQLEYPKGFIDERQSLIELKERCPDCRLRISRFWGLYHQWRA